MPFTSLMTTLPRPRVIAVGTGARRDTVKIRNSIVRKYFLVSLLGSVLPMVAVSHRLHLRAAEAMPELWRRLHPELPLDD